MILRLKDISKDSLKTGTQEGIVEYRDLPQIHDAGQSQVIVPGQHSTDSDTVGDAKEGKKSSTSDVRPLNEDELNLLALFFTLVKILYLQGAWQPLPELLHLLEPLRLGRELHLTSIRNEHAYYSSVAQLLAQAPFPIQPVPSEAKASGTEVVYMLGDSHSLSSAYHRVENQQGKSVLFVPRLVTGLKCYHLRPEGCFYPKRNFEHAIRSVPNRSKVVFSFGEIDCREGMLVALEKDKYPSLEVAVREVVDFYIHALEDVVRRKAFKAYIHPVQPVLDVTRPVVKVHSS